MKEKKKKREKKKREETTDLITSDLCEGAARNASNMASTEEERTSGSLGFLWSPDLPNFFLSVGLFGVVLVSAARPALPLGAANCREEGINKIDVLSVKKTR